MQTCPKCAYHNRDGVLACERCGKVFTDESLLFTRKMNRVSDFAEPIEFPAIQVADNFNGKITLQFLESSDSIVVEVKNRIVIGRVSNRTVQKPDVDLAPFNAFSKGVSGRHAAIHCIDDALKISDLGSVNGTYLNREGLFPHDVYDLHNGDIVQLGQLAFCVRF